MLTSPSNTRSTDAPPFALISRTLWRASVTLRGSIEPSEYKKYILPLLLIRSLSVRFERDERSDPHWRGEGHQLPRALAWPHLAQTLSPRVDLKEALDEVLCGLSAHFSSLNGLLSPLYATSNISTQTLRALIELFSQEIFEDTSDGRDLIGSVYQYFIGAFASSEGKRGGEYFTPACIVKTLVQMINPSSGRLYDPCCGSGGMFVQAHALLKASTPDAHLQYFGQEAKEFTLKLCKMNLFTHGLVGDIRRGDTYTQDHFAGETFDYILANPPFNDGSRGTQSWHARGVTSRDPRLDIGLVDESGDPRLMPLSPRNANTLWMLHILHHLAEGGTAGFVMSTGELSITRKSRLCVRQALVDLGYVDCIVSLPGQLFSNTLVPCALWILSKARTASKTDASSSQRARREELLFIDAQGLGQLMAGSRVQKELSQEVIDKIAITYREYATTHAPAHTPGFARVASIEEVRQQGYILTPGRYVGATERTLDEVPFEDKMNALTAQLSSYIREDRALTVQVDEALRAMGFALDVD